MMVSGRLAKIVARIDQANALDPKLERTEFGIEPAARVYGRRMSEVLDQFCPAASEELKISVRGQHIQRWLRPRADYPEGRDGYLRWRREAAQYHAATVAGLMLAAGYDASACDRVSSLMMKKNLRNDPEAQTLEDIACLTFFRWYAGDFSQKHEFDKSLSIVSKTARKMSPQGRSAALALDLPEPVKEAIAAASRIET
jgi:hypothetical protein